MTQCRTLQAIPIQLASLWPGVANPGPEPDQPSLPVRSAHWRKLHPTARRKLLAAYRAAYARRLPVDAQWQQANGTWRTYEQNPCRSSGHGRRRARAVSRRDLLRWAGDADPDAPETSSELLRSRPRGGTL